MSSSGSTTSARFSSSDLQHVQPWWFYIPVLLGLLFPWSATVALLPQRVDDNRRKLLLLIVVFGFVFFSAATNKLPGYLLPLLPLIAAIAGLRLYGGRQPTSVYPFVRRAVVITPVRGGNSPAGLGAGPQFTCRLSQRTGGLSCRSSLRARSAILFAAQRNRRTYAIATTVIAATLGVAYLKVRHVSGTGPSRLRPAHWLVDPQCTRIDIARGICTVTIGTD